MKMKKVNVTMTGVRPMLFHNVNSMALKKPKNLTHEEHEASEEVFKARLYMEDDKLVLPERVLHGLLKTAAQRSGVKQDGKRSTYSNLIRAVVFIPNSFEFKENYKDLAPHTEYVSVQMSKVLRIFPMLKKWTCEGSIVYDSDQISLETLTVLFDYAGGYIGVGDYRPTFGRFNCTMKDLGDLT